MRLICLLVALLLPPALHAGGASLFDASGRTATPLFDVQARELLDETTHDLLSRAPLSPKIGRQIGASATDRALFDVIALAEAGPKGYDAVQLGARIAPPSAPTEMTVGEIFAWIRATPGQHHAIGRYQFIPKTLRSLVDRLGVPDEAVFSPVLQDRLALELVTEAGYVDFIGGAIARGTFLDNLARIWAGLPTASGKSHYEGQWGNRATITRARFEAEMDRAFPAFRAE